MGSTIHFGQVTTPAALKRIQRLYLQTAMVGDLTYGQMANGTFDRFKDANGIDGSSVYTLGTGYAGPIEADSGTPTQTWSLAMTDLESGHEGYCYRQLHSAANVTTSGSQVRVTFKAYASGGNFGVDYAAFAEHSSNGNAAGVFGGSQFKELLFSGGHGFDITAGQTKVSDWLTLSVDQTKSYFTSMAFNATSARCSRNTSAGDGAYYKAAAAAEWDDQTISGYTLASDFGIAVSKVEVQTPISAQNLSLISNAVTASAVATKAIATVLMLNKDASTKVYVSTATSPSWTELTGLTKVASTIGGAGIDQYSSDLIAITGSADKSMRWKVETDAGHSTRCYGVALNWV